MAHPLQLVYRCKEHIGFTIALKESTQTLHRNVTLLPGHHLASMTWWTAHMEDHSWRYGSLLPHRLCITPASYSLPLVSLRLAAAQGPSHILTPT